MLSPLLYTKHPRPTHLSDPGFDFKLLDLVEFLSISDDRMTWADFACLLGPLLPAGTYAETAYFLPRAVDYLVAHHDTAAELITPIVGFVSINSKALEEDGLLGAARDALLVCLTSLTSRFQVIHFDKAACAAKGWDSRITYFDYVVNQDAVCVGTSDLVRFVEHIDLAEQFVGSLADHGGNPTKAAWFLELARSVYSRYPGDKPPDHAPIRALLSDDSLLQEAAAVVMESVVSGEPSPTYWTDTFNLLGL